MTPSLEYKPDLARAAEYWLAFWEQEIVDRPCCLMRAPRQDVPPVPGLPYMAGAHGDLREVAERAVAQAETVWWGGDAVPYYTPSFGPDMVAAWLGAELEFGEGDYGTNWVVACVDDWDEALPLRLDQENVWWRRMLEFCQILAELSEGKMLISHLDMHSNMDALSALRSPERLCLDMMDMPATIDRAMRSAREIYAPIYEGLYKAASMHRYGTCGWIPAYHPERTNTVQCDFAALIGPEHFRRFVVPALEEEAAYLGHCVYHFDGPECLAHLDDICSVPGLDCIQWTTGARNRPFIEWLDLLKEIQAKGVSVWVPCNTETIKVFHSELQHDKLFYDCHAPSREEGEKALEWLVRNT